MLLEAKFVLIVVTLTAFATAGLVTVKFERHGITKIINPEDNPEGEEFDLNDAERLGEGGTTVVRKAKHYATGKLVAFKIVKRDADIGLVQHEYDIYKELKAIKIGKSRKQTDAWRAGIPIVYGIGKFGTTVVLVMELLGKNLKDVILENKMDPKEWTRLCFKMFRALVYVHRMGIWHKDIKAENFLFEYTDSPKHKPSLKIFLSDFDVSQIYQAEPKRQYRMGDTIIGTLRYYSLYILDILLQLQSVCDPSPELEPPGGKDDLESLFYVYMGMKQDFEFSWDAQVVALGTVLQHLLHIRALIDSSQRYDPKALEELQRDYRTILQIMFEKKHHYPEGIKALVQNKGISAQAGELLESMIGFARSPRVENNNECDELIKKENEFIQAWETEYKRKKMNPFSSLRNSFSFSRSFELPLVILPADKTIYTDV